MSRGPRLSICVPTHHGRRATLEDCLAGVVGQLGEAPAGAIEICVSDNASRDGTEEMVRELADRRPGAIRYRRHAEEVPAMVNIVGAAGEAQGEFVWFMGSDDALAPGALRS